MKTFRHLYEDICTELRDKSYRPGEFRIFTIHDPKSRLISAAPYRDRVMHHALCNILEPIFERTFIHDSYACRKGKGAHAAVDRLTEFMRGADYVLKCDIRRYFPSVDHALLKAIVRRKISCADTLWLVDLLIDHGGEQQPVIDYFPGDNFFTPLERGNGLPIGNQTSQFLANVYLNPLDHMVKETLGCRHYVRYVDDIVVLGDDKQWLWDVKRAMEEYLSSSLRLKLHPRKQWVQPVTLGVDFLGYRVFPSHRRLRPASGYRFARRLRRLQELYRRGAIGPSQVKQRLAGWNGHAAHADTYGLRTALMEQAVFSRAQAHAPRAAGRFVEQQPSG